MASSAVISGGGYSVTLTNLDLTITHSFTNPLITLDTPMKADLKIGENTIGINIGFVSNVFDLAFMLRDGPGTFNFSTPSTNYEKLMYMAAYVKNVKTLTLNGTAFTGHIESINVPWKAGLKDLSTSCSIRFKLTKDVTMGSV